MVDGRGGEAAAQLTTARKQERESKSQEPGTKYAVPKADLSDPASAARLAQPGSIARWQCTHPPGLHERLPSRMGPSWALCPRRAAHSLSGGSGKCPTAPGLRLPFRSGAAGPRDQPWEWRTLPPCLLDTPSAGQHQWPAWPAGLCLPGVLPWADDQSLSSDNGSCAEGQCSLGGGWRCALTSPRTRGQQGCPTLPQRPWPCCRAPTSAAAEDPSLLGRGWLTRGLSSLSVWVQEPSEGVGTPSSGCSCPRA